MPLGADQFLQEVDHGAHADEVAGAFVDRSSSRRAGSTVSGRMRIELGIVPGDIVVQDTDAGA